MVCPIRAEKFVEKRVEWGSRDRPFSPTFLFNFVLQMKNVFFFVCFVFRFDFPG